MSGQPPSVSIRTSEPAVEVAWFAPLCNEDYEFLGVPDGHLRSSFEHCSDIVTTADRLGYQNILMPSSFNAGQEPLVFAGATAVLTRQIQHLVALRMGEIHPPMLARHISTLDHIMKGRLTVNIISSDLPGQTEPSELRYARSDEVIQILKQAWTDDKIDFGLRIHVIVRETEAEARAYAQRLVSKLDPAKGAEIRARSQDSQSAGVLRQDALRAQSKDDYIEEYVWSGIGRGRSGCGSALVGTPEQIVRKLERYTALGIRAFIFSGYPHRQECELFARQVLPALKTCQLPVAQGRVPANPPVTPLTTAPRH